MPPRQSALISRCLTGAIHNCLSSLIDEPSVVAILLPHTGIGIFIPPRGMGMVVPVGFIPLRQLLSLPENRSCQYISSLCLASELQWAGLKDSSDSGPTILAAIQAWIRSAYIDVDSVDPSQVPAELLSALARDLEYWAHQVSNKFNSLGMMEALAREGKLNTRQLRFLIEAYQALNEWTREFKSFRRWPALCFSDPIALMWQCWSSAGEALLSIEQAPDSLVTEGAVAKLKNAFGRFLQQTGRVVEVVRQEERA